MDDNITREDLDAVIAYLQQPQPRLTHGEQVRAFEREWSEWLGVKYSVLVNSGASANLLTMAALREHFGSGEVIVPPLTWVSDIAAVLQNGLDPVFVDIDRRTLGMDVEQVLREVTSDTKAVFLTHILGYNALTQRLLDELGARNVPLIEDCCESHGATFNGRKVGSFGLISNFSFYFAHHMSTIEGGMICTNDEGLYETVRMLRSHGMVRESTSEARRSQYIEARPDLTPDFIFAFPGYNVRPTELMGVFGRSQLKRLDTNNEARRENLRLFLAGLDPAKYQTDFAVEGSSNYAFTLVLQQPDSALWGRVEEALRANNVEFRRGLSGGGNQLRQPYLRRVLGDEECEKYPNVEHVHFHGCYIGNYPALAKEKIQKLCALLNAL
ncbi:MAG: aminotransferase class I/II-fold pyridoxal phosphate-dependent enzyme [Verrucomicrobia bacterium]|nr:aminotransferase class I/II-fold pyridoxal phosphate-dependent enzyme [Verrucomicrobiota bacterium]